MKFQRILAGLAATLALTVLSACGEGETTEVAAGGWDAIVEAAKEEGELTLYTAAGAGPTENLVQAFSDEYGIKVTLVKGTDAELLIKVETEQQIKKGIGDVLMTSDANWVADHPDAVVELEGSAVTEDAYDAASHSPNGTWSSSGAFIPALSWNTDEVPDGMTDVDDLFDPALAGGKIGIPDAATSPSIVAFYQHMEEAYGPDFLERLSKQKPRVYSTTAAVMQAIVSGEIAASFYTQPMVDEQASGAPVDWTIPSKPWGVKFNAGVINGAAHPNAAQLFMDFTLSKAGQEAFTTPKYGTPRSDVEGAAAKFADASLVEEYPQQDEVDELRKNFKKLFS